MATVQDFFRLPAEWELQDGIILMWPHEQTDWAPYMDEVIETFVALAEVITRYEHLIIAAREIGAVQSKLEMRLDDWQMCRVSIYACDTNDTWARDVAPITIVGKNDMPNRLLDFCFNGWGEKFAAEKDNMLNRRLYDAGAFQVELVSHKDFVLEGGSIETDGEGTLFTTTACLMAPNRNQPLDKIGLENKLLDIFPCLRQIVWIEHGMLMGDDTDGHIDTILRCAPNNTLLYISCDDKSDSHYSDLALLDAQVKALRTLNGEPYRCLRLPIPKAIYDGTDRLPATYANFLVLNGAVVVPTYRQPDADRRAIETIRQAFPDRDIIGLDAVTIVRQHGSLHCLTMQFPANTLA